MPTRPTVALVYDLKDDYLARGFGPEAAAEFDERATIDALEAELSRLGHAPVRVGAAESLAARLAAGERWDWAFPIAEGWRGACREAQAANLLDLYGIHHAFSDALTLALTHHKAVAKRLVRDHGGATAPFAVVDAADGFAAVDLPFPLFVKPVAEGSSKGIRADAKVADRAALARVGARLLAEFDQPVLVETFLPGAEYTVAVVGAGAGARVWAAMRIDFVHPDAGGVYSLETKADYQRLVRYVPVAGAEADACAAPALLAHRALGARDIARYDVRRDAAGVCHFIEANPLPGLNPAYSDLPIMTEKTGRAYADLLTAIVAESEARRAKGRA